MWRRFCRWRKVSEKTGNYAGHDEDIREEERGFGEGSALCSRGTRTQGSYCGPTNPWTPLLPRYADTGL